MSPTLQNLPPPIPDHFTSYRCLPVSRTLLLLRPCNSLSAHLFSIRPFFQLSPLDLSMTAHSCLRPSQSTQPMEPIHSLSHITLFQSYSIILHRLFYHCLVASFFICFLFIIYFSLSNACSPRGSPPCSLFFLSI